MKTKQTLQEHHIPYTMRMFSASLSNIKADNIEVCMLTKDSKGTIKKWFQSQCFTLSSEWKSLNKKCNKSLKRNCDIFDAKTNQFITSVTTNYANKLTLSLFCLIPYIRLVIPKFLSTDT